MKKAYAINGGPRKDGTTARILAAALEGAKEAGAETKMINLYDLDFSGCIGCAACKMPAGKSYNKCILRDQLTPILLELREADVMFFGSPMFFGKIASSLQNFFERIMQPENTNEPYHATMWPRKTRTALYLNTELSRKEFERSGYVYQALAVTRRIFGEVHVRVFTDSLMFFDGYDKFYALQYDERQRREYFAKEFVSELEEVRNEARKMTELPAELENPYRDRHLQWVRDNVPGARI